MPNIDNALGSGAANVQLWRCNSFQQTHERQILSRLIGLMPFFFSQHTFLDQQLDQFVD